MTTNNNSDTKLVHVAVGVLIRANKILVAQRPNTVDYAGHWEFPGGKVEIGENVYDALCREFQEEVGLEIISAQPLIKIQHAYKRFSVLLDVWKIEKFLGEAQGLEGQIIRWVDLSELKNLPMLEANDQIIEALEK